MLRACNHYTFSGKEWDEHLDSYEFGYRLYDPAAGVWLTQDPLRGEPSRPRTLHRYQYVFASPISYRDAYGLWPAWLDQTAQSVAQSVGSAAESVTTTVNNARQSAAAWCNDHEEVVQAAIIGAAVVAATAVTVATAGAGAPLGAMIVGATVAGATGAGAVTLARNAIDENRPWHEDLGESLQAGAAIGFGIGGIGATIAVAPAALAWGGQVGASTGVVASSLGASAGVASFAGSVASVAAPGGFLLGTGGFYGAASSSLNPYFSPQSRARAGNVALLNGSLGMLSYFGGETLNAWGMRLSCAQQIAPAQGEELTGQAYIDDILKNELRNVYMTRHPQYATREGLTQYGMSWRDQSTYISQYAIDEGRTLTVRAILHEELHHRFWARGIEGSAVHHELMAPIIDRFMK